MRRIMQGLLVGILCVANVASGARKNVWLSRAEVLSLDTTGTDANDAWRRMRNAAIRSHEWPAPDLKDQNAHHGIYVLAAALTYAKDSVQYSSLRAVVRAGLMSAKRTCDEPNEYDCCGNLPRGSPGNTSTLSVGRQLATYVIAADLIDFEAYEPDSEAIWRSWMDGLRSQTFPQGNPTWPTLKVVHDRTCSNQGLLPGASLIAAAMYLRDTLDMAHRDSVFRSYTNRSWYPPQSWGNYFVKTQDFTGNGAVACDSVNWVAINPACTLPDDGTCGGPQNMDGCVVEDFSRGRPHFIGVFCPADSDSIGSHSYSWNAINALSIQAEILENWHLANPGLPGANLNPWGWGNNAVLRATDFQFRRGWGIGVPPFSGVSSQWPIPWIINRRYGTNYPAYRVSSGFDFLSVGTMMHWTNWTHGRGGVVSVDHPAVRSPRLVIGRPGVYDLQGRRVQPTRPGVYLERKKDGSVRRFVVLRK